MQVRQQLLLLESLQSEMGAQEASFRALRETYERQFEAARAQVAASEAEVGALAAEVAQLQVRSRARTSACDSKQRTVAWVIMHALHSLT